MKNPEWTCTKCGTVNRTFIYPRQRDVKDRCIHCRTVMRLQPGRGREPWRAAPLK